MSVANHPDKGGDPKLFDEIREDRKPDLKEEAGKLKDEMDDLFNPDNYYNEGEENKNDDFGGRIANFRM